MILEFEDSDFGKDISTTLPFLYDQDYNTFPFECNSNTISITQEKQFSSSQKSKNVRSKQNQKLFTREYQNETRQQKLKRYFEKRHRRLKLCPKIQKKSLIAKLKPRRQGRFIKKQQNLLIILDNENIIT